LVIFSPLDEVFFPSLFRNTFYAGSVTVETFKPEIAEAMKAY